MNDINLQQSQSQPKQKSWFARHKILTGVIVVVFLIIIGAALGGESDNTNVVSTISNNTASTSVSKQKVVETIKISARDLYSAYNENEIKADSMYKDKILEVTGSVGNISKDILDDMFVTLKGDEYFGDIQCMLEDSELSKAANLQKGSTITVQGENSGLLMNVILNDCIIK